MSVGNMMTHGYEWDIMTPIRTNDWNLFNDMNGPDITTPILMHQADRDLSIETWLVLAMFWHKTLGNQVQASLVQFT